MNLLSFLMIILPIVLCPGPMTLTISSISASHGFVRALFSICGGSIAYLIQLSFVSVGIDTVLLKVPSLIQVIKFAGMAYLFYLAWRASKLALTSQPNLTNENISALQLLRQGLIVGLTNPKSLVIFSVIFPSFLTANNNYAIQELTILTMIFLVTQFSSASMYALMGPRIFDWFAKWKHNRLNINSVGLTFAGLMLGLT